MGLPGVTVGPPSPSPRKAWIETPLPIHLPTLPPSRLPPGRRGLKQRQQLRHRLAQRRLPPGRRGLKQLDVGIDDLTLGSPSPRKAWIETRAGTISSFVIASSRLPPGRRGLKLQPILRHFLPGRVAFPRKAWIETSLDQLGITPYIESPSPRKAWIETGLIGFCHQKRRVAFPPEGVD